MYVILTSKTGQFRTEPGPGLAPIEAWDYRFAGKHRARFVIARLDAATRITLIEDEPPHVVNSVPSKFLPRFDSVQAARDELAQLTRFAGVDTRLEPGAP